MGVYNMEQTITDKEIRRLVNRAERHAYIDFLSYQIGNAYIETYNAAEVIGCYGIDAEELREYTLEIYGYDDEDTVEYFKYLWEELQLVCDLCEQETDLEQECKNSDCEACGEDYKPEE